MAKQSVVTITAHCAKCKETKVLEDFPKGLRKDGTYSYCKTCMVSINQRNYNAEARRRRALKEHYNITPEDYDRMFFEQDGKCAICLGTESYHTSPRLHVDHCHNTGAVRGLLCSKCNTGIAKFEDQPESLRRAADYLEIYNG